MKAKDGFSKIDLLILIICAIFALANICSVGKLGRENARRMICASNITQQLSALLNFAGDNEGKLPAAGGYWPCDISCDNMNILLENMGISVSDMNLPPYKDIPLQKVFYCPSNFIQKKAETYYWNFATHYDTNLHKFTGYRVMVYFYLWAAGWNSNGTKPINGPGDKKWVSTIFMENPSETELITDVVYSDPSGNFDRILCGGMAGLGYFDSTSHLKTKKEPYGGNVGFVDGHIEWRPFSRMYHRFGYSSCPSFWW